MGEWVRLRVTGIGPIRRLALRELSAGDGLRLGRSPERVRSGSTGSHDIAPSTIGVRLAPGERIAGPAIVEEFGSTTVLPPGFAPAVDQGERAAARDEYGVVLARDGDHVRVDEPATTTLRARLAADRGPAPFFDRGPGYRRLSGRERAEVDVAGPRTS